MNNRIVGIHPESYPGIGGLVLPLAIYLAQAEAEAMEVVNDYKFAIRGNGQPVKPFVDGTIVKLAADLQSEVTYVRDAINHSLAERAAAHTGRVGLLWRQLRERQADQSAEENALPNIKSAQLRVQNPKLP